MKTYHIDGQNTCKYSTKHPTNNIIKFLHSNEMLIIRLDVIITQNISKHKAKSSEIAENGNTYKNPINSLYDDGNFFKINLNMRKGLQMMNYYWRTSDHFVVFHPHEHSHNLENIQNCTPNHRYHTP